MGKERPAKDILALLEAGPVVFDGAMGTLLYQRGIFINRNFDELNLSRPDMVLKVHLDYLEAGAMVLTTNTFGANAVKLGKYGLEDKIEAINRAGVRLARSVASNRALVAGSIGPSGLVPDIYDPAQLERLRDLFEQQARFLCAEGVDLILLETFRYPLEMRLALEGVRRTVHCPIAATLTFDEELRTADGHSPARVAHLLASWGADVIGANCGEGPSVVFEAARQMLSASRPVLAQANAGRPRRLEGRVMYMTTPEYFGEYAKQMYQQGVRAVGGCCGTTPDHIRQVASQARMLSGGRIRVAVEEPAEAERETETEIQVTPMERRSELGKVLASGRFLVSVEVDPPPGLDWRKALVGVAELAKLGVRFVNVADGPRATARMSALAMAVLLAKEISVEPILHVTCRDRNLLGIQGDLLGAHALGIRNLLIVTGDPTKLGDYPMATTVYDLDSIGLLRLAAGLNKGFEPSGRRMDGPTSFVLGSGVEPGADNIERELDRLKRKVEAGAQFVMTQPVFDPELMDRFLEKVRPLGVPVVMGILPLASYRNAEFLHHEVPGMRIPEPIRERMKKAGKGPAARREGALIGREMLLAFKDRVQGCYIIPQFGRYETVAMILGENDWNDMEVRRDA